MAEKHELHLFDAEKGYFVAQNTDEGEDNCWHVCNADGDLLAELNDEEFNQLRDIDQDNPKGL